MNANISKGWNKMGSSNASRNGRGGTVSGARHAKRAFDAGEDDLVALCLDEVMSDRPWTGHPLSPESGHVRKRDHQQGGRE